MPALLLIVVFIVVPLVELYVIVQVGQAIGVLPTIGLLLVASILGAGLLRAQGRTAWRRLIEAMRAGRVPHREAFDGALILFGGALLLTPGFLTDVGGLFLLAPPTRATARRVIGGLIARRAFVRVVGGRRAPSSQGRAADREYDVEGTASEPGDGRPGPERQRLER